MAIGSYGQTSPQGLDPWSIESVLAPLATGGSRAEAQNMLGHYQIARDTAQGQYENDLAAQHQYAYDQLHQQLYEAKMKTLLESAKSPGATRYFAGVPGMDIGGNATNLANYANAADFAQAQEGFQKSATGLASAAAGGFQPTQQQAETITGGLAGPRGDPTAIGVAKLNLQGQLARANAARAAGSLTTVGTDVMEPDGTTHHISQNKVPPEGVPAAIERGNQWTKAERDKMSGVAPAPGGSPQGTASPTNQADQSFVMQSMDALKQLSATNPAAKEIYDDVAPTMQGAKYPVQRDAAGNRYIVGKSGKPRYFNPPAKRGP